MMHSWYQGRPRIQWVTFAWMDEGKLHIVCRRISKEHLRSLKMFPDQCLKTLFKGWARFNQLHQIRQNWTTFYSCRSLHHQRCIFWHRMSKEHCFCLALGYVVGKMSASRVCTNFIKIGNLNILPVRLYTYYGTTIGNDPRLVLSIYDQYDDAPGLRNRTGQSWSPIKQPK